MVVVQARAALHKRSAAEECAELVTIARYLVEAVSNEEITLTDAELAIVDWTHDPDPFRTAVRSCRQDQRAAQLLQRVSGRGHSAA